MSADTPELIAKWRAILYVDGDDAADALAAEHERAESMTQYAVKMAKLAEEARAERDAAVQRAERAEAAMTKTERGKVKRLVFRLARVNYAEGVCEASEGEGPTPERRRRASRLALDALLATVADIKVGGGR